ncbi:MAG: hypothetical protein QOF48_3954 [Verrucomicrobiota bacterium]|jgi:hypothetical protein
MFYAHASRLRTGSLFFLGVAMLLAAATNGMAGAEKPDKADWWAFKPATPPKLPLRNEPNPIDRFIRAKLEEQGLQPSPATDPATFIRRLTYDLTGLPPTPAETEDFTRAMAGDSQSAMESLVDRLLASPRHGERWARLWLDVVHFGETHGYDKDKLRPNAWPYRDYVIRSFNNDKPWSRFVEEQIAGDILHPDDPDGVVALGFIAAGPWDFVGHVELPESKTDGLIARYNDRDDMVMTTFSAFQSLTVHCARCHDHKFDPITQRDYYSLQAVFAGVDRAERPFDSDPDVHRRRRALLAERKTLESRQRELQAARAKVTSPELASLDQQLSALRATLGNDGNEQASKKSPSNGYHSNIEPAADSAKWVQVDLGHELVLDELLLIPARPTDFADTPGFGFPVRFKVEAAADASFANALLLSDHTGADVTNPGDQPFCIRLALLPKAIESPGATGDTVSAGVLPGTRIVETNLSIRVPVRFVRVTATRLWERTHDYVFALAELVAYSRGRNVARGAVVTALDSIESGRWARKYLVDGFSSRSVLGEFGPADLQPAQRSHLAADLKRLAADRERVLNALVPGSVQKDWERTQAGLTTVSNALAELRPPSLVYAAANEFKAEGNFHAPADGVRPVHLLPRGDVQHPLELMSPGAPACAPGPDPDFHLPISHAEGQRRAALARWMVDPRNLQTRRSIVNRVWQYHFGRGLVDTPNDFGHMGSAPTHPELLDWLAFWFLENGESLKKLHRLIVTSATYRQASGEFVGPKMGIAGGGTNPSMHRGPTDPANLQRARALDGDNRLLWRMNRTRLDAECVRDAMLFVSGELDFSMGGPGDRQFYFKDDHSPVYDYARFDVDSKEGRRRSIYRHIVRSVTDPFMDCLDAADPSQLVARRNITLTALQALATLNNPFVLRQCEHFAERLEKLSPELDGQIAAAYRLALNRAPAVGEQERLRAHARKHGLVNACRVLLNSTEFMFVD